MTRWKTWLLGALMLAALAAGPAQAVVVDLTMIDTHGNPLPGYTFTFNWPDGRTSSLTTDASGRLHGDVPKGEHFCSFWSEDLHLASGRCDLTDLPGYSGAGGKKSAKAEKSRTPGRQETPGQAGSIAPQPTPSEQAASKAVARADSMTIEERRFNALKDMTKGPKRSHVGNHLILLSSSRLGSSEFGVVLAQLFDLDGSGDSSSSGDGGGGGAD